MNGRSPNFTHENAARARRALCEMYNLIPKEDRLEDRFRLVDEFLKEAQRFAPFEGKEPEPERPGLSMHENPEVDQ